MWLLSDPNILANPKSETLPLNSSSIKMLLDFISRCTTFGSIASWRYASLQSNEFRQQKGYVSYRLRNWWNLRFCSAYNNLHAIIPGKNTMLAHSSMKPLLQVTIVHKLINQHPIKRNHRYIDAAVHSKEPHNDASGAHFCLRSKWSQITQKAINCH